MPLPSLSRSICRLAAIAGLLVSPVCVWAAGGAHFVEDSEVVDPGTCSVDFWVTRFDPQGGGYANATPTCTLKSLPWLEWGVQYQYYWFNESQRRDNILGPNLKANIIPEDKGIGVGLYFNSGVNLRTGDLEVATLLVPVTVPLNDSLRLNFNAGWSYIRIGDHPDALFWGAQVEAKLGWDLSLMLEAFGRVPGTMGAQAGLRWRPNDGPIDFDLLAGNFYDELNPRFLTALNSRFFTVGLTVRW